MDGGRACLFVSGPDLRPALLLELPGEVGHDPLDRLVVERAALVLQHEAQGVGFLAFGELVALDVEQRDALEQLALRSEGHLAQRGEGDRAVDEQCEVAFYLGELR